MITPQATLSASGFCHNLPVEGSPHAGEVILRADGVQGAPVAEDRAGRAVGEAGRAAMTTDLGTRPREPVAVPQLQHGDIIRLAPHEVFRHTDFIHLVACREADVEVECLIVVEHVIVVCWHGCPGVCGATVFDADDSVMRLGVAA